MLPTVNTLLILKFGWCHYTLLLLFTVFIPVFQHFTCRFFTAAHLKSSVFTELVTVFKQTGGIISINTSLFNHNNICHLEMTISHRFTTINTQHGFTLTQKRMLHLLTLWSANTCCMSVYIYIDSKCPKRVNNWNIAQQKLHRHTFYHQQGQLVVFKLGSLWLSDPFMALWRSFMTHKKLFSTKSKLGLFSTFFSIFRRNHKHICHW